MKNNNTESKLREISREQLAEPPSFVWDNIEKEVQPKKSKRKIIYWFLGFGVIASILLVTLLTQEENNTVLTTERVIAKSDNTNKNETTFKNTNTTIPINNTRNDITFTTNKVVLEGSINESNSLTSISTNNSKIVEVKNIDHTNTINSNPIVTKDGSNNFGSKIKTSNERIIHNSANQPAEKIVLENKERINFQSLSITSLNVEGIDYKRNRLDYHDSPSIENKSHSKYFIELGILSGLHNIALSQHHNNELYHLRNSSETSWYTTGIYSNFGFKVSSNWHISIGAEWTMSKDRFASRKDGVTKMVVSHDSATGTAIDTSFISGTIFDKGDNTFHFIDIPLSIGYTLSKNKWQYGIELSGILNIKTTSEGKVFTIAEGEENATISSLEGTYKKTLGLGLRTSVLLGRKLNDQYALQVRPSFKTYLNDINSENYSIDTKYRLLSLSVGLRKMF